MADDMGKHTPLNTVQEPAEDLFTRQVTAALQRMDAPDGFTERLMARSATCATPAQAVHDAGTGGGILLHFRHRAWRAAYAAAALVAITAGTALHVEHRRAEERRAEAAAAQFDEALQVTHHALDHVSATLQRTEFGEIQRALEAPNGGEQ